jgi:FtsP/CotA-like multicopper oxidase with cupredoxin domain
MSKIKLVMFVTLIATFVVCGPAAAFTPAPPLPGIEGPGGVPHYFGPYGNWAYSPLPMGPVASVNVVAGGTGYSATPAVTIADAYITPTTPASVTAVVTGGVITGFTINSGGADYVAPVVIITDPTGTGALADAVIGAATLGGPLTGGIRKFVDSMPGLGPAGANNLGQYIPVGVADTAAYPGSDYYEIAVVEYTQKMHTDLPPTKLRGYVQLETPGALAAIAAQGLPASKHIDVGNGLFAIDNPHYLGPLVIAQGRVHGIQVPNTPGPGDPVPVRVKFYNLLPTGTGGDLFIPVDETVPGAGLGPAGGTYTQNRAAVHLHGNNTVWISDGNVHMWITPSNENTPYPKGVSVRNVPDMGTECDAANSGCLTFFYTNAQSARLQFYHDHALAITRLNVYAGEAAGYVITDAVEQDMINGTNVTGVNPTLLKVLPDIGIPLVIQDKSWVDPNTIYAQDPTWNMGANPGSLWYPHVYMSVQNPYDLTGTNAFGRWHYGPWFNPPTPECVNGLPVGCIEVGPVPNEYYQPDCDLIPPGPGCTAPWEPPFRPGVPNPSIPGESFMDTPLVNGTAYPYLEVEPKAYRFRVLNAANDRMVNLQLYVAADKTAPTTSGTNYLLTPARLCEGSVTVAACTEVKMVPISVAPANQYADTPGGIPDPTTKGPDWILIGTEGGFMPKPVVVPQQPIGYNLDPAYFSFGIVNQHSLFVGSAERVDVVVDFTNFAGKTLILYNDSPAPVPAAVPGYDYFTGNANLMDVGGAPTTQPGYGPNTRTIMQIRVTKPLTTPTTDVTLANLNTVFAKTATKRGVFEVSQDPIIIPQTEYNSAYNNTFSATARGQYIQIADVQKTFQPINEAGVLQAPVTLPLEMKAMHDEMGGVYDTQFGRMSGMLGLSNPASPVHVLIPYGLAAPPTDLVKGSVEGTPIGVMPDGTQIWRIFHNGVDTHTIHTHLFHAQLINRVDQSGQVTGGTLPVDPIDLGWKDTFKVNPLEITYLAMRPTVPTPSQVPFEVPDSVRLIDPTLPEGATLIPPPPAGWFDPAGNAITAILNHYVNFGWEYVWHCHILSHEEMDMMHSLVFAIPPKGPTGLGATVTGPSVNLAWTDNSTKEAGFSVQRASDAGFTTGLKTSNVGPNIVTFSDTTVARNTAYWYRVFATGAPVGDLLTPGFPTMAADSTPSNTATATVPGDTVNIVRATYNATNQTLTVWATSSAQPNVALTVVGYGRLTWIPNNSQYQKTFSGVATRPASITVTSSGGGSISQSLLDTVTIVRATYSAANQRLVVWATSSAQPNVALTVVGYGRLTWIPNNSQYQGTFNGVASAPASVTVTSSGGGSATQTVPFP